MNTSGGLRLTLNNALSAVAVFTPSLTVTLDAGLLPAGKHIEVRLILLLRYWPGQGQPIVAIGAVLDDVSETVAI